MTIAAMYATADELAAYWRPLSDAEQQRANVLLGAAADLINEQRGSDSFIETARKWVSLDIVKRIMQNLQDGVTEQAQGMADMTSTTTFANPTGSMYITSKELARLNGWPSQSAFSVPLKSNVRVPLEPWNYQQSTQADLPEPNPFPYPYYPYPFDPEYS